MVIPFLFMKHKYLFFSTFRAFKFLHVLLWAWEKTNLPSTVWIYRRRKNSSLLDPFKKIEGCGDVALKMNGWYKAHNGIYCNN